MGKINQVLNVRHFLSYQRQSYCAKLKLKLENDGSIKFCSVANRLYSSLSSLPKEDTGTKQLLQEFPEPKKILWRVINEAYTTHKNPDVKPSVTVQQIEHGEKNNKIWQVTISMTWPEKFEAEGRASKKSDAETISLLQACQKMKDFGLLDSENKPILPEKIITFGDKSLNTSKSYLCNLFQRIWAHYGRRDYIPKFENTKENSFYGKDIYWRSQLTLAYPEKIIFDGYSSRLGHAEGIAATKALHWLKDKGLINEKHHLIRYSLEDESRLIKYHSLPYSICIPKELQSSMTSALSKLEKERDSLIADSQEMEKDLEAVPPDVKIYDIITDEEYSVPSDKEILERSQIMFNKNASLSENTEPFMQDIKKGKSQLPIAEKRADILRLLDENQVVILSGETGCGKTTQVPQYILEDFINKMKGANCNIVVTQPRRISAISIAERVAAERGEMVGDTVGHHVRLNKNLPKEKGAILFCSTGMLLRKLCSNPDLQGVSHIIIDEVHERNIQIDFLLILLKRLLDSNKNIKLLLMSATFNTFGFSQYFRNCPVIHVSGKIHPIKEYFLEDLKNDVPCIHKLVDLDPVLDPKLVVNVINHIDTTQKSGAILCFLPGWHEILSVKNKLLEACGDASKLQICCAHSRLPHEEQKLIFQKAPEGARKVILATNIAETSITVDDVVFVVNSGLHKGITFNGEQGVTSLGTQWITKANIRQRRGRAGRVQPGVCYNLFTRRVMMNMDEYPLPELLRMPLETVILDCKLYCPDTKAEDFLSMAIQPPNQTALQTGVNELQVSGVLDENEDLTDLGKIIVNFPTHPRLSVALLYAAFLGCLDPVLTICAILTLGKEPFENTLEDKSIMKSIKQAFDNNLISDHLALSQLFSSWSQLNEKSDAEKFVKENSLDEKSLYFVKELKNLFAESLFSAGVIDNKEDFSDPTNRCNINSTHAPIIFAALTAAFYPNVIKVIQGEITRGRLNKDSIIYSLLKGQKGFIQKESLASDECELPSPWLLYFSALQSEARRLMMTSNVSAVPGAGLLLLGGQELTMQEDLPSADSSVDNSACLRLDGNKKLLFSCGKDEAELILKWRMELQQIFSIYIQTLRTRSDKNSNKVLSLFETDFLPVLKEVLSMPQLPFTKGQVYKFVNNNLVSENI